MKQNPGPGEIGGVCRDSDGSWIWDFYGHVKHASNQTAEILAVKQGLIISIEKGISHLIIELDSEVTIGLLNEIRMRS